MTAGSNKFQLRCPVFDRLLHHLEPCVDLSRRQSTRPYPRSQDHSNKHIRKSRGFKLHNHRGHTTTPRLEIMCSPKAASNKLIVAGGDAVFGESKVIHIRLLQFTLEKSISLGSITFSIKCSHITAN